MDRFGPGERGASALGCVTPGSRRPPLAFKSAAMWPVFEEALAKYQDLETQLSDPLVVADRARFARTAKEHGKLAKQVKPYLEFKKILEDLAHAEALAADADPDMKSYAEQELT